MGITSESQTPKKPLQMFQPTEDIKLSIKSCENMKVVCEWMENRFFGLPLFHQSVDIKVIGHQSICACKNEQLSIPKNIEKLIAKHLKEDFNRMVDYINSIDGEKTFALLHLKVKLEHNLLRTLMDTNYPNALKNKFFTFLACNFCAPVTLALASVKTKNNYESLAVGIKGISHYSSVLRLKYSEDQTYDIKAGLDVAVNPAHLAKRFLRTMSRLVDDKSIINEYLEKHLKPEKEQIVKNLCAYVFNENKMPEKLSDNIFKPQTTLSTV